MIIFVASFLLSAFLCSYMLRNAFGDRLLRAAGAIAMGHPTGASGARIMANLTYELRRTGGKCVSDPPLAVLYRPDSRLDRSSASNLRNPHIVYVAYHHSLWLSIPLGRYGVGSACCGSGMGIAVLIERC